METVKKAAVVLVTLSMFTGVVAARDEVIKNNDKPVVTIQKTGMISVEKGTEAVGDHSDSKAVYEPSEKKDMTDRILVNTASRILTLYRGKEKAAMYPVGVGKASTPTPSGYYRVETKEVNPEWIDPEDTENRIASGPGNPLGYRWIGFSGTYGIHGTNSPESVGGYVSNGCVRMREQDVEDLYSRIHVGTAVDIMYDRIVINADPDHTVAYYIYPDGYSRQYLTVGDVKKALAGYGVDTFEDIEHIQAKIAASDGSPTYVAKAYDLVLDGKKLSRRALGKGGVIYLPAQVLADVVDSPLVWNGKTGTLSTERGQAQGVVRSDVLYIREADLMYLFPLTGSLDSHLVYRLKNTARS